MGCCCFSQVMGCCGSSEAEKQPLVVNNKITSTDGEKINRKEENIEEKRDDLVHHPPNLPSTASMRRRSSAVPPLIINPPVPDTSQKDSKSRFESIVESDSTVPDASISAAISEKSTFNNNNVAPATAPFTSSSSNNTSTPGNAFKKRAIAQWDYAGNDEYDQLAFRAGDEIVVLEEDEESGWWWGEINGKEGHFPVNYTEIRKPEIRINQGTIDPKIKALQATLANI